MRAAPLLALLLLAPLAAAAVPLHVGAGGGPFSAGGVFFRDPSSFLSCRWSASSMESRGEGVGSVLDVVLVASIDSGCPQVFTRSFALPRDMWAEALASPDGSSFEERQLACGGWESYGFRASSTTPSGASFSYEFHEDCTHVDDSFSATGFVGVV